MLNNTSFCEEAIYIVAVELSNNPKEKTNIDDGGDNMGKLKQSGSERIYFR